MAGLAVLSALLEAQIQPCKSQLRWLKIWTVVLILAGVVGGTLFLWLAPSTLPKFLGLGSGIFPLLSTFPLAGVYRLKQRVILMQGLHAESKRRDLSDADEANLIEVIKDFLKKVLDGK